MSENLNIGLNTREKPPIRVATVTPASTNNIGMLINTRRGVPNKAIRITQQSEFDLRYNFRNSYNPTAGVPEDKGAVVINHLYQNLGDNAIELFAVRVAEPSSLAAKAQLNLGTTLFRDNRLVPDSQITISFENVNSVARTFDLIISRSTAQSAEFLGNGNNSNTTTYTGNLANVGDGITPNTLIITLGTTGDIITDDGSGNLIGDGTGTIDYSTGAYSFTTTNAIGLSEVITADYQWLNNADVEQFLELEFSTWQEIILYGDAKYPRSSLVSLITNGGYPVANVSGSSTLGDRDIVVDLDINTISLHAGQLGYKDPGTWGNELYLQVLEVFNDPGARNLVFYYYERGQYIDLVSFNVSNSGDDISWTDQLNGVSFYAMSETKTFVLPDITPPNTFIKFGTGDVGSEKGTDVSVTNSTYLGNSSQGTGLYALNPSKVSIIGRDLLEGYNIDTIQWASQLETYCQQVKKYAIGLVYLPYASIESQGLADFTQALLKPKSFLTVAMNNPTVAGLKGERIEISGIGGYIGSHWIRKMLTLSGLPHEAAGGEDAAITGILDMEVEVIPPDDATQIIKRSGVNPITQQGDLFYAVSSRTMSTDNYHYNSHKRRTLLYWGQTIIDNFGFLVQAPHNPDTWDRAVDSLDLIASDHYQRGMFDQTTGYEGAVRIVANENNNTESDRANRKFTLDFFIFVVNTIEVALVNIYPTETSLVADV